MLEGGEGLLPHDAHRPGQRIGVLTFHRCINYGSYWQARCLVEALRRRGHDAVLLDYRAPAATVWEHRLALRPTLPTPVSRADQTRYAVRVRRHLAEVERLPLSAPFPLVEPDSMEPFDTIVVGSDEVWNLRHPTFGGSPAFWGEGLNAPRLIVYAASFGNYSCWEGIASPWTERLLEFDAISVRDENSWWMLKHALGAEFPLVLDPCLAFPPELEGPWRGPAGDFVLVYGHNFSPEFAERARRWAGERGLRTVSIGYGNAWADDEWIEATPQEFAHAFSRATAVVTGFFHGCVFSLLNGQPFVCEGSPYRSIKVRDLMSLVRLSDRLWNSGGPTSIEASLSTAPSEETFRRIDALRGRSIEFLTDALQPIRA